MFNVYRCALLALIAVSLIAVSMSARSFAQSASSSAASATVASSAAPAKPVAKPPAKKQQSDTKHFIEVNTLASSDFKFGVGSCFSGQLSFPSTQAAAVVKLLGSQGDFTLTAIPPDKIAIYNKSASPKPADLQELENQIQSLTPPDFSSATAIRVPTGSAGKSVAKLTLPSDGSIVVKAVGSNCILIVSKSQSDPLTIAALKKSISGFYWDQPTAPPTQRLFYVDATAVAKKLSGSDSDSKSSSKDSSSDSSGSGTAKPAPAKSKGSSSSSSKTETATVSSTSTASPTFSVSPTVSVSVVPGSASSKAATGGDSAGDDDSSDSNDESGQSNADKADSTGKGKDTAGNPSAADKTKSKPAPAPTPKPLTMQPVNDMLVYSNEDGSDRGIVERNRLMAVLDLPRPEVLMNIWSLQASSGNYQIVTAEAEAARELIAHHNDLLQQAIDQGWDSLSRQMKNTDKKKPPFFDDLFYRYITQKFGETDIEIEPALAPESVGQSSHAESSSAHESSERKATRLEATIDSKDNRSRWGWCDSDKYCLGFSRAFEPLRPTFTNLLIGIIAAKESSTAATATVNAMENSTGSSTTDAGCKNTSETKDACANPGIVDDFHKCMKKIDEQLHTFRAQSTTDCEIDDRIAMSEQILSGRDEALQLRCFRKQAERSFGPDSTTKNSEYSTTRAGLLRAAVADFLFNYKWATQYPHDFIPYDLTQSAQELNAEFNPLVLAFNRDVSAFTENLQSELQCKYEADISRRESTNWFKRDDRTFINDGMLSVRGISGVESLVDTVTQSFFDATNPPSLTDLVKSVSDAEKNIPGVLQTNLTANEAAVLLGALNSVQPAEAKIGRELKLDITPHALAGASSAELEVKLTAEEAGSPTRFTADKSSDDTLSRIAKHDVTTRVRVESLKLFDVSAFSAMLQRPRSKFPIVPPFFEVPYFGSFLGWPLAGAKVYHRSTAIVSAIIVPTAADLAFGIDFSADRFCDEDSCYRAKSPYDFGSLPLRSFHKAMIQCFASGENTAYTGTSNGSTMQDTSACKNLKFETHKPTLEKDTAEANKPLTDTVPPIE